MSVTTWSYLAESSVTMSGYHDNLSSPAGLQVRQHIGRLLQTHSLHGLHSAVQGQADLVKVNTKKSRFSTIEKYLYIYNKI